MVPSAEDYGNGMHSVEAAWEDKDPDRLVVIVHFKDRESYVANAERSETDQQYQQQLEYLDGEPEWIDVNFANYIGKPELSAIPRKPFGRRSHAHRNGTNGRKKQPA